MVKGAWENLLTGLTDPAQDLDALIQNLFDSLMTAGENLEPRVEQVLIGISKVISKLAPPLIEAVGNLIPELLPVIIQGISDLSGEIMNAVGDVLDSIGEKLSERFPELSGIFTNLTPIVAGLAAAFAALKIELAVSSLISALVKSWKAYKAANEGATIAQWALNAAMSANPVGLVIALIAGLVAAFVVLWNKSEAFRNFWIGLWDGIKNAVSAATDFVKNNWKGIILFITNPIAGAINLLYNLNPKFHDWVDNLIAQVKARFVNMVSVGKNIVEGLWQGIINAKDWLLDKIKSFAHTITQGIKDFFGIKSPSRVMRDEVGKMLASGVAVGISKNEYLAITAMKGMCVKLEKTSKDAAKNAEELKKKQQERELENLKNALDLQLISEQEYYEKLKEYRDKYFEQGTDNWYSYTTEIAKYNKKLADEAIEEQEKIIEKISSMQKELANKLRENTGSLLKTTTVTIKGIGKNGADETYTNYSLADIEAENKKLERYKKAVLGLKDLGNVSAGIFTHISQLSIDEGTKLAETILNADEENRERFLKSYRENDELSNDIASELNPILNQEKFEEEGISAAKGFSEGYKKQLESERESFIKILEDRFGTLPEYYYTLGTDAADEFEKGFFERVPEMMERFRQCFRAEVNAFAAQISATLEWKNRLAASASGGNTYSTTYSFNASKQTVSEQIHEAKKASTLERLRGGY